MHVPRRGGAGRMSGLIAESRIGTQDGGGAGGGDADDLDGTGVTNELKILEAAVLRFFAQGVHCRRLCYCTVPQDIF